MARALLAKRARQDLIEIRRYTVNRWGKEQARKYISKIGKCADDLADHRLQGKLREKISLLILKVIILAAMSFFM